MCHIGKTNGVIRSSWIKTSDWFISSTKLSIPILIFCNIRNWILYTHTRQVLYRLTMSQAPHFYLFVCLFIFWDKVLLCIPGYSDTHYVDNLALNLHRTFFLPLSLVLVCTLRYLLWVLVCVGVNFALFWSVALASLQLGMQSTLACLCLQVLVPILLVLFLSWEGFSLNCLGCSTNRSWSSCLPKARVIGLCHRAHFIHKILKPTPSTSLRIPVWAAWGAF